MHRYQHEDYLRLEYSMKYAVLEFILDFRRIRTGFAFPYYLHIWNINN